ncbi:MAG: TM2 domain-containing protein [Demequina sp.]|nr:TM2 domain-containing protein [Demequina sp.]
MTMMSGAYSDMSREPKGKNLVVAYVLWFFLGVLGAHRYYVGQVLKGLLFLIGTVIAVALSQANSFYSDSKAPIAFAIIGGIIGLIVFVFWVIDAFKIRRLVAGTGKEVASKVND